METSAKLIDWKPLLAPPADRADFWREAMLSADIIKVTCGRCGESLYTSYTVCRGRDVMYTAGLKARGWWYGKRGGWTCGECTKRA